MEDDAEFDEWQVRYTRDMARKMASSSSGGPKTSAKASKMNKEAFLKQMQDRAEKTGIA